MVKKLFKKCYMISIYRYETGKNARLKVEKGRGQKLKLKKEIMYYCLVEQPRQTNIFLLNSMWYFEMGLFRPFGLLFSSEDMTKTFKFSTLSFQYYNKCSEKRYATSELTVIIDG